MEIYLTDLLEFIGFVANDLKVPGVDPAGGPGGITILVCPSNFDYVENSPSTYRGCPFFFFTQGWSKGCVLAVSLLALLAPTPFPLPFYPAPPPPHLLSPLVTHLRSVLLFEPPGSVLSRPPTPKFLLAMGPAFAPDCSDEDFAAACDVWLEAYSDGTPPASKLKPSGTKALEGQWGKDAWEPYCLKHGFDWKLSSDAAEVREVSERALAKVVQGGAGDRLETLPVGVICGARTGDYFDDSRKTIVQDLWVREGEGRTRKTAQKLVEGTNHFAFIHEPERFADALVEIVDELGA